MVVFDLRPCAVNGPDLNFPLASANSLFILTKLCVCVCVYSVQDNLSVFLRGCEELGLKGSQLFDPGDLQDASTRPTTR